MDNLQWQYLLNLTNAYNIPEKSGRDGTRCMYSLNVHRPESSPFFKEYFSQEYQDFVLDNFIFHRKTNGFFLDIGANDPFFINNTIFFEKNRNWIGLAFEPLKKKFEKWNSRKTECLQIALGAHKCKEEFIEYAEVYDYMSGFSQKVNFNGTIEKRYLVDVYRLDQILLERGIRHVDYVSLDVEGMELEVLQGIDFSSCDITSFTIELQDKKEAFEVRKLMIEHGYEFIGRLWQDDLWVKKGFVIPDYNQ